MPLETFIIRPKCEAIIPKRDPVIKRMTEHVCGQDGARYLIIGGLATVEQNLCAAHKKKAQDQHKDWSFEELKWAVKKEIREVAAPVARPVRIGIGPITDEEIPF